MPYTPIPKQYFHLQEQIRRAYLTCLLAILALGWLPQQAFAQFTDMTLQTNLGNYKASSGDDAGLGGTFADLNNDGYPDLVLLKGPNHRNFIYANTPNGIAGRKFVRFPLGPVKEHGSTGAIAGDYDNDGDLDLYITNSSHNSAEPGSVARNVLYRNDGNFQFTDVTADTRPTHPLFRGDNQAGVGHTIWTEEDDDTVSPNFPFSGLLPIAIVSGNSLTAAWADVNRDGWLDLYVGNHDGWYGSPQSGLLPGQPDTLYRNNGDGTFNDITRSANVPGYKSNDGYLYTEHQFLSSTSSAMFLDWNDDGWPDLVVNNRVGGPTDRSMIYLNLGQAQNGDWLGFSTDPDILPQTTLLPRNPRGMDAADFNNNGTLDLFISSGIRNDMLAALPGSGQLPQVTATGINITLGGRVHGPSISPSVHWLDVNNDGFLDLFFTGSRSAGHQLWIQGSRAGFQNVSNHYGFSTPAFGAGALVADYNRDGALDIFAINFGPRGSSTLWQNQTGGLQTDRNFLTIKLQGNPNLPAAPFKSTRDAIGAKVMVTARLNYSSQTKVTQRRDVVSGSGSATSSSSLELEFGMGTANHANIAIYWPSGRVTQLDDVATNQFITIMETLY